MACLVAGRVEENFRFFKKIENGGDTLPVWPVSFLINLESLSNYKAPCNYTNEYPLSTLRKFFKKFF